MSVWDDILDFFTGETKKKPPVYDKAAADKIQGGLYDRLEALDQDFKGNAMPKLEDYLPPETSFDYRNAAIMPTAEDIAKMAKTEAEGIDKVRRQPVERAFDEKMSKLAGLKKNSVDFAYDDIDKVEKSFANLMKKASRQLGDRGLSNSSIEQLVKESLWNEKQKNKDGIIENSQATNANIDAQMNEAETSRDQKIATINDAVAIKEKARTENIMSNAEKEKSSVDKENAAIAKREAAYEKSKDLAVKKHQQDTDKQLEREKKHEDIYGEYLGEKGENYRRRLEDAKNVYAAFPKDVALELVSDNYLLKKYLGYYYTDLIGGIQKRSD